MGRRGEIFSSRLLRDKRTYFFNVHENFGNSLSLSIVESKSSDDESAYHRQSVLVFQEDLDDFLKEMQKAVSVLRQQRVRSGRDDFRPHDPFDTGKEITIGAINKRPISERSGVQRDKGAKRRIVIKAPAKDE